MPQKREYINLYFTKDDREVLAWANMIRESKQNLGTWIQGILVAESTGADLDIGSIKPPCPEPLPVQTKPSLFGDDTTTNKKSRETGWNVRGKNGELKDGSVLSIKVTRQVVQESMFRIKKRHQHLGVYIKVLIRQKLKKTTSPVNRLPNPADLIDLFILTEDKRNNFQNNPQKKEKNFPKPTKPQQNNPPRHAPTHTPTPTHERQKREERQQQPSLLPPKSEQKVPIQEKEQGKEPKKNPLLKYI